MLSTQAHCLAPKAHLLKRSMGPRLRGDDVHGVVVRTLRPRSSALSVGSGLRRGDVLMLVAFITRLHC